jgi:hypothetical protein
VRPGGSVLGPLRTVLHPLCQEDDGVSVSPGLAVGITLGGLSARQLLGWGAVPCSASFGCRRHALNSSY